MSNSRYNAGSVREFDSNWAKRNESRYTHWTDGRPLNQVQFAFRQHWEFFQELMGYPAPGESLEVGCGRGSLSNYFSAAGWRTTLLDSSPNVIRIARAGFEENGHGGQFVVGDANDLPFEEASFDVVFSIGLLEHFEDIEQTIREQWRVVSPGGWLLMYIVPERPDNLQRYFNWVNACLKWGHSLLGKDRVGAQKEPIFRNDYNSQAYLRVLENLGPESVFVSGMYSMPMVSHSPEFPFSLMCGPMEKVLVRVFAMALALRKWLTGRNGWLCSESMGQAFLVAAKK